MRIILPWGLIAIFISLSLFYYFSQKAKIKKEEKRERLKARNQEYLDSMLKEINKHHSCE